MKAQVIFNPPDVTYLDPILLDGPFMRLLPASDLLQLDPLHLRIWCLKNARYQLVTAELVAFLLYCIRGRSAIEIGSGMGDVCHHLGIQGTDSGLQTTPAMIAYYMAMGQAPTVPPPSVERLDALDAVQRYEPQVVIGCWVTQKYQPGDEVRKVGSNIWGVDEPAILHAGIEEYIHVGHYDSHGDKRIITPATTCFCPSGVLSRAEHQHRNTIWRWQIGGAL